MLADAAVERLAAARGATPTDVMAASGSVLVALLPLLLVGCVLLPSVLGYAVEVRLPMPFGSLSNALHHVHACACTLTSILMSWHDPHFYPHVVAWPCHSVLCLFATIWALPHG